VDGGAGRDQSFHRQMSSVFDELSNAMSSRLSLEEEMKEQQRASGGGGEIDAKVRPATTSGAADGAGGEGGGGAGGGTQDTQQQRNGGGGSNNDVNCRGAAGGSGDRIAAGPTGPPLSGPAATPASANSLLDFGGLGLMASQDGQGADVLLGLGLGAADSLFGAGGTGMGTGMGGCAQGGANLDLERPFAALFGRRQ
jgi:hypothetical protein